MSGNAESASTVHLKRFLSVFTAGADRLVVELRALVVPQKYGSPRTECGFFELSPDERPEKLAAALNSLATRPAEMQPEGIYVTLNPVNPDLLARLNNRLKVARDKNLSAGDTDVVARRWLLLDVDPKRPGGISATDNEKEAAKLVFDAVREDLRSRGWSEPMVCDSGNGYHGWYRINLPRDDGKLVEHALKALAAKHNTATATIDTSVFNPSRIVKIPGTWARKGDSMPDRPHRIAMVLEVPANIEIVTAALIETLAAEHATTASRQPTAANAPAARTGFVLKVPVGTSPVARCRAYLAKVPGGIEGDHGSDQTFQAARIIWNDFGIDKSEGYPLLQDWNRTCAPPWPEEGQQGLNRKWDEAEKQGPCSKGRGWKLHEQHGQHTNGAGKSHADAGGAVDPPAKQFEFIDSAVFLTADYRQRFLIDKFLVANETGVVAGPSKTLKTSLVVDAAISLASASPFLGTFAVPVATRVALVSGESGQATLQATAKRIMRAKDIDNAALGDRLKWCFTLPQFPDPATMTVFAAELLALEVCLVFIDPVYLCMGGEIDHANLFEMGAAFRVVAEKLLDQGVTPILVHHANRSLKVGEPMEIMHLAYSGLEQFARQYVMINRQTSYRNDGNHDLWVSASGSAGHAGLWNVRVEEGVAGGDFTGRVWSVTVVNQGEVFARKANQREEHRAEAKRNRAKECETRTLEAIDAERALGLPGAPKAVIKERGKLKECEACDAIAALLKENVIEVHEFKKEVGQGAKRTVTGYRRVSHEPAQRTIVDNTPTTPPEPKQWGGKKRR